MITILEVVIEMYSRGINFENIDLYKSDATKFLPAGKNILPPLNAMPGVGTNAAKSMTNSILNSTLKRKTSKNRSVAEKALTSAYNTAIGNVGRQATTSLVRGLLGTLLK